MIHSVISLAAGQSILVVTWITLWMIYISAPAIVSQKITNTSVWTGFVCVNCVKLSVCCWCASNAPITHHFSHDMILLHKIYLQYLFLVLHLNDESTLSPMVVQHFEHFTMEISKGSVLINIPSRCYQSIIIVGLVPIPLT